MDLKETMGLVRPQIEKPEKERQSKNQKNNKATNKELVMEGRDESEGEVRKGRMAAPFMSGRHASHI